MSMGPRQPFSCPRSTPITAKPTVPPNSFFHLPLRQGEQDTSHCQPKQLWTRNPADILPSLGMSQGQHIFGDKSQIPMDSCTRHSCCIRTPHQEQELDPERNKHPSMLGGPRGVEATYGLGRGHKPAAAPQPGALHCSGAVR